MKRKIYQDLLNWKEKGKKPLLVLGARQVGKTYIINEFCKREFRNYRRVNLLNEPSIVRLYDSNQSSKNKYMQLKMLLGFDPEQEDSILFVDEAQESESFIVDLKYLNEEVPTAKIVVAGSLLGIKLKQLHKPFPVGKIDLLNLYPMNFEEYLMAIGREDLISLIREHYERNEKMPEVIHEMLLDHYRRYLICGGMPENLQNYLDNGQDITKIDPAILNNINEAYVNDMNRYVRNFEESIRIRNTYNSLPSQLINSSHKFQYAKIEEGARRKQYESVLNWLNTSGLTYITYAVKNPQKPLAGFIDDSLFKVFMSDVGLLNRLINVQASDIMSDSPMMYKGVISENYVAQQFTAGKIPLFYWRNDNIAEIDFLLETAQGVVPVEVKAAENKKAKSLRFYCERYDPAYAIRITSRNFGYDETNRIKSVPLYAVFCLS